MRVNAACRSSAIASTLGIAASVAIIWYFERNALTLIVEWLNLTGDARGSDAWALVVSLCVLAMRGQRRSPSSVGTWGMNHPLSHAAQSTPHSCQAIPEAMGHRPAAAATQARRASTARTSTKTRFSSSVQTLDVDKFKTAGAWLWQWARRALSLGADALHLLQASSNPIVGAVARRRAIGWARSASRDLAISVVHVRRCFSRWFAR